MCVTTRAVSQNAHGQHRLQATGGALSRWCATGGSCKVLQGWVRVFDTFHMHANMPAAALRATHSAVSIAQR
jgi:hypothetical protein